MCVCERETAIAEDLTNASFLISIESISAVVTGAVIGSDLIVANVVAAVSVLQTFINV